MGVAPPPTLEGVTVPVGLTPPTVPVAMILDMAPANALDEVNVVMVGLTVSEKQELVMLHDELFKSL